MLTAKQFSQSEWKLACEQITGNQLSNGAWERLERAEIACICWDKTWEDDVAAWAWMGWDTDTFYVFLQARETPIVVKETKRNGEVYKDSCLECFFMPPNLDGYYNLEINAAGVIHLAFGAGRHGRVFPEVDVPVVVGQSGENWMVAAAIPTALWQGGLQVGDIWRGNFQKCCEAKKPSHHLTWNVIGTPKPDFHQPDYFGEWVLGE